MFLKILGLILLEIWITIIITLTLILINMFPTDFNPLSSTAIFLFKPQLNFIMTTSVTLLINKSYFQKLVISLYKTSSHLSKQIAILSLLTNPPSSTTRIDIFGLAHT